MKSMPHSRLWPRLAALALAMLSPALWAAGESTQAAATPSAQADTAARLAYQLDIVAPDELRNLLLAYLDLARFQAVTDIEAITPAELDRLIVAAPAQARALLETEGYFSAVVKVVRGGLDVPAEGDHDAIVIATAAIAVRLDLA